MDSSDKIVLDFQKGTASARVLRRGQVIKCSQHPSVLLIENCVLVTLENLASSFSFRNGRILENTGFEVMVLDIQSQTCIFVS